VKGYRTLIFALVVAVLGVIEQSAGIFGDNAGVVLMVVGALSAALRTITDSPVPFKR
jgi:hypothetical protein